MNEALDQMKMMQQSMPADMGGMQKSMPQIFEAYFNLLYSLVSQTSKYELLLGCGSKGVRLDQIITPVQDTSLEKLFSTPVSSTKGLSSYLPSRGALRMVSALDYGLMMEFAEEFLGEVIEAIPTDSFDMKKLMDMGKQWNNVYDGSFAMDFALPGKSFMSGSAIYRPKDKEAALKLMLGAADLLKDSGLFELYESMGFQMDFDFKANARKYKNYDIHRTTLDFELKDMPPEMTRMIDAMYGDMKVETAIVDKWMVCSFGTQPIEEIIDAVKSGRHKNADSLFAEKIFPPGGIYYIDYNFGLLFKAMAKMMEAGMPAGQGAMFNPFANFPTDAKPMAFAAYFGKKKMRINAFVPIDLIKSFADMASGMQGGRPGM